MRVEGDGMSDRHVSVVVVTYDSAEFIESCLEAVAQIVHHPGLAAGLPGQLGELGRAVCPAEFERPDAYPGHPTDAALLGELRVPCDVNDLQAAYLPCLHEFGKSVKNHGTMSASGGNHQFCVRDKVVGHSGFLCGGIFAGNAGSEIPVAPNVPRGG